MTVYAKIQEKKQQIKSYQKYMNYCTGLENIEKLAKEIISLSTSIQKLESIKIKKSTLFFNEDYKIVQSKIK